MKCLRDSSLPRVTRLFIATLTSLIVVAIVSATTLAQTPVLDAEEQAFLKLINDYRAQNGLSALKVSIALTTAAKWMSGDMAAKNYFPSNHVDSLGRDPFKRMADFGYGYNSWRGENIAAGYADAANTFNQWKNSPGHNANMLNANYTVIGIGRVYGPSATYRWYWTNDFGSYVDATMDAGQPVPTTVPNVATVNAASYQGMVTPDSLAATYGSNLTSVTVSATSLPLPTVLGNTTVTVDGTAAQLLFVSPTQINYVVPRGLAAGTSTVRVTTNGSLVASGKVSMNMVNPSIFTFSANGQGVPAGLTTFDGIYFQSVANPDGTARPLSAGTNANPNYLVLFCTGIRNRQSLSGVQVSIGGVGAEVQYAGAQGGFAGLDQINVKIPTSLRSRGSVDVVITADGYTANRVTLNIGS
ncbi:MAG TPA: CAP domain-containing protein [Blastocatellia bacterium]|nr:CAP domain-containing protein [Blastocatellia bacterium]